MAKKLTTGTNGRYKPDMFQGFHDPIALNQSAERVSNELNISRQALNRLLDPRRDIDKECGYPPTSSLTPQNYRDLYDREPIATRTVDLMAKESWQVQPLIYETEDEEDVTDFEQAIEDIEVGLSGNSWHQTSEGSTLVEYMFRADRMSGIGHFSVVLLGIDDGLNLQDAVDGVVELDETVNPTGSIQQMGDTAGETPDAKDNGDPQTSDKIGKKPTGNQRAFVRNLLVRNVAAPRGMRDCYMKKEEESALLNPTSRRVWNGRFDSSGKPCEEDYTPAPLTNEEREIVEEWRHEREAIAERARTLNTSPQNLITNWGRYVATQPLTTNAPFIDGTDRQYSTGAQNNPNAYPSPNGTDQQYFGVQFGPSQEFKTPSGQKRKLVFMRVFDESLVQIVRYEWNVRNPRFGQPVMYRITLNDPRTVHSGVGLPMATVFVHWSRVVHVPADNRGNSEVFGVPELRPVLNPILDIRKGRGASAEGLWQAAFSTLSFETHPQLGGDVDVDINSLKDQYEANMNGLQRAYMTRGMAIKTISPTVTDPTPYINIQIEAICIQKGCPVRVFKGSERGELASSQDDSSWNDRLHHRQITRNTPVVVCAVLDRLILLGVLPEPGKKGRSKMAVNRITRIYNVLVPASEAAVWNVPLKKPLPKAAIAPQQPDSEEPTDEESAGEAEPTDTGEPSPEGGDAGAEGDVGGSAAGGKPPAGGAAGKGGAPQATPGMIEKSIAVESTQVNLPTGYTVEWPDLDSVSDKDKAAILAQRATAYSTYVTGNLEAMIPPKAFMTKFDNMTNEEADAVLGEAQAGQEAAMGPLTMPMPGERGHPATEQDEPLPPQPFGGSPKGLPGEGGDEDTSDMGAVGGEGWPDEEPQDEESDAKDQDERPPPPTKLTKNVDDAQHMDGDTFTRLRQTCKNLIQQVEAEVGAPLEDEDKEDLIDDFLTELGLRDIDAADMVANCGGAGSGIPGPCPKVGTKTVTTITKITKTTIVKAAKTAKKKAVERVKAKAKDNKKASAKKDKGKTKAKEKEKPKEGKKDDQKPKDEPKKDAEKPAAAEKPKAGEGEKPAESISRALGSAVMSAVGTRASEAVSVAKDEAKGWLKGSAAGELAERISLAKGSTPEEASALRGTLATLDAHSKSIGAAARGEGSKLAGLPTATIGYLAYSSIRHPIATAKAALGLVKDKVVGAAKSAVGIRNVLTVNELEDDAQLIADAYEEHDYNDWYIAIFHGCIAAGLETDEAITLAGDIYDERGDDPVANGYDADQFLLLSCGGQGGTPGPCKSEGITWKNDVKSSGVHGNVKLVSINKVDHSFEHTEEGDHTKTEHGEKITSAMASGGTWQAPVVREGRGEAKGRYIVMDGDHRLAAARANGLKKIGIVTNEYLENCGGEGGTMGPCPHEGEDTRGETVDKVTDAVAKSVGDKIKTGIQSALSGLDDESLGGVSRIVEGVKGANPLAIAQGAGGIASTIYKCVHQELWETALAGASGIPGAAIVAKVAAVGLAHAETAAIKGVTIAGSAIIRGIAKAVGKLAGSFGGGYQGVPQPAMVGNVSYAELSKTDKALVDIMVKQVSDAVSYVYDLAGIEYSVDEDALRERVILTALGS